MISKPQKEMFDKITTGELTAKQKGDFYFRMSKVLKKRLDELDTISYLLDKIPSSYLGPDKIDFMKAAVHSMDITETLVEQLDPAFVSPILKDNEGKECDLQRQSDGTRPKRFGSRIIRRYKVNMKSYLPGLTEGIADAKVSYEPSEREIEFLERLTDHQSKIDEIRAHSERDYRVYSLNEFNKNVLPRLKKRGANFDVKYLSIVGNARDDARDF